MDKLFLITAKCVNQNSSIIEIAKDDLKLYLGTVMDYSLENKPEILETMSLTEARKLMYQNAIDKLESYNSIIECITFAIVNLEDIRDIDLDAIPYIFDIDDLLDHQEVTK
jgi:hypothetical protein